ncbi:MAG: iron-sulfur cluster assembly protein [Candidatus Methanoperedens sp.]|nr:iron-sulfur cluster assembly protein [Candidatus Methanoperedens sp.]
MIIIDKVMQAIKEVVDPEIGLNVADLNMIKKVNIDDKKIEVRMVLTAPFCPLAVFLVEEVKKKVRAIAEGRRWILWCLMNHGYHLKDSGDEKNIPISQAQESTLKG